MPEKPKALFTHCKTVYEAMERNAQLVEIQEQEFLIYRGYLTRLITDDLNLPVSYYTYVTRELIRMDCIRNYKRGGGAAESEWLLLKVPTEHDYYTMPELIQKLSKKEAREQQWKKNIEERIAKLEKANGL